ncbi:cytochrome P450 [Saccharopolyspora shandongensis]|uniref:cytochrome P450 family protein n=1 Tax=Saccharopolyspora shandongensis TaxID=418495 RepID=UPI00343E661E
MGTSDVAGPAELSMSDEFLANPHPCLAAWRESGPAQPVVLPDGRECWVVTHYPDVVNVLSSPHVSCDLSPERSGVDEVAPEVAEAFRSIRQGLFINMDPPDHTRLRKLVVREFSARRVEALRPQVRAIADKLLDALDGADEVDLVRSYSYAFPVSVLCALLGIPEEDAVQFREWTNQALGFVGDPEKAPQVVSAVNSFYAYFEELLDAKRRNPEDDLLSALVTGAGGEVDDRELAGVALLLFVAGHETTSHSLALGVLSLLDHPAELAVVREDPTALAAHVDELLRYDGPSTPGVFRFTTADIQLDDTTIPAGSWVLASLAAANRDPARFSSPDALDFDRAENQHVAFGRGMHYCLGASLAKVEMEIGLGSLFQRYPNLELAVPVEKLRWRPGYMRAVEELPVRLGPLRTS